MFRGLNDLVRATVVYLFHALHLSEFDVISFLVDVSFVFMSGNNGFLTFLNHHNDEVFGLFSIGICDHMVVSEVNEGISPWTEGLGRDVSASVGSANHVSFFLVKDLSIDDHFSLADDMELLRIDELKQCSFVRNHLDFDVRVQLLQFVYAGFGS